MSGQILSLGKCLQPIGAQMRFEIRTFAHYSSMILALLPLRKFNYRRHENLRINLGLLPIGDGFTLAQKLV